MSTSWPPKRKITGRHPRASTDGRNDHAGSGTGHGDRRQVTARDIKLSTETSGDRNPLRYDDAAARRSRSGRIVVQGGVTSALLDALVAEDLPGPGSVFLHVDCSFRAPVGPGDAITAEAEVLEARSHEPITRLRTAITNQDGVVVLDGTALVYREPLG